MEGAEQLANFNYIGKGYRLLSKQYKNGDAISYLYDQGRRLTEKSTKNKNNSLINKYRFSYNKIHMRTAEKELHKLKDNLPTGKIFEYDSISRLKTFKNVQFTDDSADSMNTSLIERSKTVQLDKVDNIIKLIEQKESTVTEINSTLDGNHAKLNQYTTFGETGKLNTFAYDLKGNMTQKTKNGITKNFQYDYRNQIVEFNEGSKNVKFRYDALGRRIEKEVNGANENGITRYLYSGHQCIEEQDISGFTLKQYVYGAGIDNPISFSLGTGINRTDYYFHTDAIGNITAITDKDGEIKERYEYDLYGKFNIFDKDYNPKSESSISNEFYMHSRRYDKETGLMYFRARYYDMETGRFLSPDPQGYRDSANLYQGFGMNPVNFVDPFGLEKIIKMLFRAVGGPSVSGTGLTYNRTPTKSGSFVVSDKPFAFVYCNPYARYAYSRIPWGAPLKVVGNKKVMVKVGGKWKPITDYGNITYDDIQKTYTDYFGDTNFPKKWLLNDYAHIAIGLFEDKNNNKKRDAGEKLKNDILHPTPYGEGQKAQGIKNENIDLEVSHGCIHVTPDDIDLMINKGYIKPGMKFIIHKYNEKIPKWKSDSTISGPYEIHFFPGEKKLLIVGEK
jgi:RHS repeat-associated protein